MPPASTRTPHLPTITPAVYVALVAVLLLAAAQRITNIDGPALWTDEGFTAYTFTVDLFAALVGDRHPPFYFVTLHAWSALAGDTLLALRWWSFLPSMLTIALGYQLGREVVRLRPAMSASARAGVIGVPVLAALFMTLADAENYMAQELRMYTWHVCFAAAASLAYMRHAHLPTRNRAVVYGVMAALLLYTHYFGAFVLIAHGLHALAFLRGRARSATVAALVGAGLLFAPWFLAVTLRQFANEAVCVNCATASNLDVLADFGVKWLGQQWPLMALLLLLGTVTLVDTTQQWRVRLRPFSVTALLGLLLVLPIAATFALGHEELVLLARRMVQITVPVTLLFALGTGNLRPLARVIVVVAVTLYGVSTIDWYRQKVPWDDVATQVAAWSAPGDTVLVEVGFEEAALRYHLQRALPTGVTVAAHPVWGEEPAFAYYDTTLPALLAAQESGAVLVVDFVPGTVAYERLDTAGFKRVETRTIEHLGSAISIHRYERR